jgi:hypothetical protein
MILATLASCCPATARPPPPASPAIPGATRNCHGKEGVGRRKADESSSLKDIVERASEPGLLLALAIVTAHDRGIDDAMARARRDTDVSPRWS